MKLGVQTALSFARRSGLIAIALLAVAACATKRFDDLPISDVQLGTPIYTPSTPPAADGPAPGEDGSSPEVPPPVPEAAQLAAGESVPVTRTFKWELCLEAPLTIDAKTKLSLQVYPGRRRWPRCPTKDVTRDRVSIGAPVHARWEGDENVSGETREIGPAAGFEDGARLFEWFLTPRNGKTLNVYVKLVAMSSAGGRTLHRSRLPLTGPQSVTISPATAAVVPVELGPAKSDYPPVVPEPKNLMGWVVAGVVAIGALVLGLSKFLDATDTIIKFWNDYGQKIRTVLRIFRLRPASS